VEAPYSALHQVNTYGSLRNANAACGGIFHDQSDAFMGGFSANLGDCSVFEAEIMGFIIEMEMEMEAWRFIWIEGDTTSALLILPIRLWFRFGGGIDGIIFFLMVFKCSHLIFSAKEMVVRTSSCVMVMLSRTWFGWMLFPTLFGGISLGTSLGYLIFVFQNFCFFFLGFWFGPPLLYIFFLFLRYIYYMSERKRIGVP